MGQLPSPKIFEAAFIIYSHKFTILPSR